MTSVWSESVDFVPPGTESEEYDASSPFRQEFRVGSASPDGGSTEASSLWHESFGDTAGSGSGFGESVFTGTGFEQSGFGESAFAAVPPPALGDVNTLTNIVFFARHPERQGRGLSSAEPGYPMLADEWTTIRDTVVALGALTTRAAAHPGAVRRESADGALFEAGRDDESPASYIETALIRSAMAAGRTDENTLSDMVFFKRHPERNGRLISRAEPNYGQLSSEWLIIRDALVRPLLRGAPPSPPPGATPGAPAPSGGVLRWGENANSAVVPPYAIGVLTDIVKAAKLSEVTISSTQRTPRDQARVMFNNCRQFGPQSQIDLYSGAGDKVVAVYVASTAAGRTDEQIQADMERKIVELGPPNVSRHTADPRVLAVIDIAPSSIKDKAAFEKAVRADGRVSLFLLPPTDPAYHVEIKIPQNSTQ
jgi:hypothetical protein